MTTIPAIISVVVVGIVLWALWVLHTAPTQEDLGITDPPSLLDDLDTDEGTPW